MHYVLVLMGIAIVAILVCVVFAAAGRGGEMARFDSDYAPPDFGGMAGVDVALIRPPTALWGYHMQVTDDALSQIASAMTARDIRIASLERQIADLRARPATAAGAPEAGSAAATQSLPVRDTAHGRQAWPGTGPGTVPGSGPGTVPGSGPGTAPGAGWPGDVGRLAARAEPRDGEAGAHQWPAAARPAGRPGPSDTAARPPDTAARPPDTAARAPGVESSSPAGSEPLTRPQPELRRRPRQPRQVPDPPAPGAQAGPEPPAARSHSDEEETW